MNSQALIDTARMMVADDKGLMAMDESNPKCNKRFAKWGIPQTEESRRAYRELIVSAPGLGESISGAILYDETIRQKRKDGTSFIKAISDAGIIPGIKVDTGAKALAGHPGEKVTEGLDGLRDRLAQYSHSERRHRLGESDEFINQKVRVALAAGLDLILCVGETLDQRKAEQTEAVLDWQLTQGLVDVLSGDLSRMTIAYEPLWAIGNLGHHATPRQAEDAHALIRRRFARIYGEKPAQAIVIQYGGSVKPENAASILSPHGVDGALIGSASLHAEQFLAIVPAGISESQTKGKSA